MIRWLDPSWWIARRLERQSYEAMMVACNRWKEFRATVHFSDDTTLTHRIRFFIPPLMENFHQRFPKLMQNSTLGITAAFAGISASGDLDIHPAELKAIHDELLRVIQEREASRRS